MRNLLFTACFCSAVAMADPSVVIRVDMEDGLQFASGNVFPSPSGPLVIFVKAPASWLVKGSLTPLGKAAVLAKLYGPTWEQGNDDGSRYVVKTFSAKIAAPNDPALKSSKNTWFYQVSKSGTLDKRGPEFAP